MAEQHWDPNRYARNAGFVAELGMPVVELLDPKPGERILDLGCGDGVLTAKLQALGCDVVGVDASADQIEAAKARGLDARVVDATALPFNREFDAVFSNAVLHWIKRPDDVIAGVARGLRPGGRFVGEFGGSTNVAAVVGALTTALARRGFDAASINPWYFPTPDEYRTKLEAKGFEVRHIELFPRPTPIPGNVIDWLETFGETFTKALPEQERAPFLAEVQEALRPKLCDADGKWTVDYVRLRFAATLR
ncbi:MAG: methyltransferase domain-containing protein [Planctomycetaceae bacterium]